MSTVAPELAPDAVAPICPACGYDLRGSDSLHCPECGFDRTQIANPVSTIPWSHRTSRGYVRSWLATVWQFNTRTRWIGLEMSRGISMRDARRFWFITAMLLSLPILGLLVVQRLDAGPQAFVPMIGIGPGGPPSWVLLDLLQPWIAGALIPGLIFVASWLAVLFCTGVHTYLFHPRGLERRRADRAVALSYYLASLLVPPMTLFAAILLIAEPRVRQTRVGQALNDVMDGVGGLVVGLVLIVLAGNAIARVPLALRRTTGASILYTGFAVLALPAMWAVCIAFTVGFLPWSIGYLWLTIDSFR